jgi:hypothetical protein
MVRVGQAARFKLYCPAFRQDRDFRHIPIIRSSTYSPYCLSA